MILYHGSTIDIKVIDLEKSKPNKDFGKGFYLSDNYQQAFEMASFKAELFDLTPVVNEFEFDETALSSKDMKVRIFKEYSKEWAEFIYDNRTSTEANTEYDIVYGPIANDRIGLQIRRLMEQDIDLATFLKQIKYLKGETFQYYFGTQKAINLLKKVK